MRPSYVWRKAFYPAAVADDLFAASLAGRSIGLPESAFMLAEWTEPGGPPGPPRLVAPFHLHHHDDEAWYVLEGTLAFQLGDEELEAPAGSAVFGPRGVPHTFWNPGRATARYLLILTPNTMRLIKAISGLRDRDAKSLQALFREHDCEIVQ